MRDYLIRLDNGLVYGLIGDWVLVCSWSLDEVGRCTLLELLDKAVLSDGLWPSMRFSRCLERIDVRGLAFAQAFGGEVESQILGRPAFGIRLNFGIASHFR